MNIVNAIILGIVQGITEFLPISSDGHLSLFQHALGLTMPGLMFDVMLHIGTLLAVLAVYYKLILRLIVAFFSLLKDLFTGRFKWKEMDDDRRLLIMLVIALLPLFLLFVPVPGTGGNIKKLIESASNSGNMIITGLGFLVTCAFLLFGILQAGKIAKRYAPKKGQHVRVKGRSQYNPVDSICVGIAQAFATLPGVSRSGSTLGVSMMRGINRQTALDFSFVLGIPAILAASVLELKDAMAQPNTIGTLPIIIGVLTAAVVGFFAIKLLKMLVSSNKLHVFVWYTLILGVVVTIIGIIEQISHTNLFTGATL